MQNRRDFDEALTFLQGCDFLAFDTETDETEVWDEQYMLGISFYSGGRGFYFPFFHRHDSSLFGDKNLPEEWLKELGTLFADETKLWTTHNAPFDINVLRRHGIEILGLVDDTIPMIHLGNENYPSYKLDWLSKVLMGVQKDDIRKKVLPHYDKIWESIPPIAMGKYAVTDAKLHHDLHLLAEAKLRSEELLDLWQKEDREFLRVLTDVIAEGILLDRPRAAELEQQARSRMQEIERILGFVPSKQAELCHSLHGLPEAGGLGLAPLGGLSKRKTKEFPQGLPNTDSDSLARLELENPSEQVKRVIDLALEYRGLQKAASTYYAALQRKADKTKNLVHPDLKQHGTVTGRLSGDMQQIPRDIEKYPVKTLFISPPGWELWEFDYNQIELRLAVVYAQCEALGKAYIEGVDIHDQTARLIGAYEAFPDNPAEGRQVGKHSNFLLGYLGSALRLQVLLFHMARLVVPLEICQDWHTAYHQAYPEFRTKAYEVIRAAEQRGYILLWNGRKRRFPDSDHAHKAWNSLIQGGAGMIMKHTMMQLHRGECGFKPKMVNQVHDSLWIYLPTSERDEMKDAIIKQMEWPTQDLSFPFPVEAKRLDHQRAA